MRVCMCDLLLGFEKYYIDGIVISVNLRICYRATLTVQLTNNWRILETFSGNRHPRANTAITLKQHKQF